MRVHKAAWALILVVVSGLLGAGMGAAAEPAALGNYRFEQGPFQLETQITHWPASASDSLTLDVTVTNTGVAPLRGILPDPCHSPLTVTVSGGGFTARKSGRDAVCPAVLVDFAIEPGKSYTESFSWVLPAGDFSVQTAFALTAGDRSLTATFDFPLALRPPHWADSYLADAVRAGWISGYPHGSFDPDAYPTRAEFKQFLARAGGLSKYTQVEPGDADAKVTRIEVAAMVVQVLGLDINRQPVDPARLPFIDNDLVPEAMAWYVKVASDRGVIRGYGDGTFRPDRPLTWAEAVIVTTRTKSLAERTFDQ